MATLPPYTVPVVIGTNGRVNTPPATLQATLISYVSTLAPGYTASLPMSLIEDVSSTCVGALTLMDNLVTDLINSVAPLDANSYIMYQLGQQYGVPLGQNTNTSVYVVFSGSPGYLIPAGFVVGDGTYQYVVQDGGAIGQGGTSAALYCVANQQGSWAVPQKTVTTVVTTVPSPYTVTCTNPQAGTPSAGAQIEADYRAQVYLAGRAPAGSFASLAKSYLYQVPGVQPQLVSFQQQAPGWKAIVGGGDPYAVASAIFDAGLDISALVGSVMTVSAITQAASAQVTTILKHGFKVGDAVTINAATPSGYDGTFTVQTVVDLYNFTVNLNSSGLGAYTANSAYLTPNSRNIVANIINYPDIYSVTFVNPPQQSVAIGLTWNTSSPYAVSASAVAQLAAPALQSYVNSIVVGNPINEFELIATFQAAVASLIPAALITRMVWAVQIDGVLVSPQSGTGVYAGDPESYFYCSDTGVTVTQG